MELTLIFLVVALAAYTLFGGADFGGGILEATLWRHADLQKKLQAALAPVWEANHVWLIAVIVILFVGFPAMYANLCTLLFVPVSLALLGIIIRGAFFTFRKYDPDPAPRLPLYSFLFRFSSALTPMMFGMIIASLLSPFPRITDGAGLHFAAVYIDPWATGFGVCCALFVFALFGYVASVFFFGELREAKDRDVVRRRIWLFFAATFFMGGVVLAYGAAKGVVDPRSAVNPVQILVQAGALMGVCWLWWSVKRQRIWSMRLASGTQVVCILSGWFATQYPVFMKFNDGTELTIFNSSAPPVTLLWLNIGLVAVLSLVLPLLVYLYRVFGSAGTSPSRAVR